MQSRNYKVSELCDMITDGMLCTNQSTQRAFVYAMVKGKIDCGGDVTKAGAIIHAIIEDDIQLPAVYFWKNTDTGRLNVHDGKQRLLSIYYFINPQPEISVCTIRHGRQCTWNGLSEEDRRKLLDYEICVMTKEGNSGDEERSFHAINSNSLPLTEYECLSGMLHGTFLTEFEKYVDCMSRVMDYVKPVGRGEQAFNLLLTMFRIRDGKRATGPSVNDLRLNDAIRPVRNSMFVAENYSFDRLLFAFNEVCRAVKGIRESAALSLADMLVRRNYDVERVLDLYRRSLRRINDIKSWDIATHQTFVEAYVNNGLELDPQRLFAKDVKDELYRRSPRCSHVDDDGKRCTESNYSKLEVDHIIPWSEGGRTVLDNAQLLCKHHNAGKGAKI